MLADHPDESELLEFSTGALGGAARSQVLEHLDACDRCREIVSSVNRDTHLSEEVDASRERTRTGDPLLGQMLGEYRVIEQLSQGGMGMLYRGEQPMIGKPVAIKVLLPEAADDPNLVGRLLGEARAVNAIRHPNIVDIFSFGQLPDGRHYMVMELLDGLSLAALLHERDRLDVSKTLLVLTQCLAALEAAHAAGVIHRDLKPDNIFVNPRADGWSVTLLDFGLAKQKGSDSLTAPNMVMGTPGYMAPEQIRGQVATPKTDIYAMGVVAWHLLAGREPFESESIVEVMRCHLDEPTPPLRPVAALVPAGLEALIFQMMAKDPAARPTATETRKMLARLVKELPTISTLKTLAPITQPVGRTAIEKTSEVAAHPVAATHPEVPAVVPPVRNNRGESARRLGPVAAEGPVPAAAPVAMAPKTVADLPAQGPTSPNLRAMPSPGRARAVVIVITSLVALGGGWALFSNRVDPEVPLDPPAPDQRILPPDPRPQPAEPPPEPPPVANPNPDVSPPTAQPRQEPPRPPRPVVPKLTKADLERSFASTREQISKIASGPTRRIADLQLNQLEERLKNGEAPAALSRELRTLTKQYDLK